MINTNNEKSALFKIYLEFSDNRLVYSPSLSDNDENNFMQIIKDIIKDICLVGAQINKVAKLHEKTEDKTTYAGNSKYI